MASSLIETTLRDELGHYPGVELELKNGGKHDRAVFHFGKHSRFLTIPKTPSDWRTTANMRRDLKKTMAELGAERTFHNQVRRKGRRTRTADAAFALNSSNVVLLIPAHSKLLDRFRTPDGKPTGFWEFEFRSSVDLNAPPQFVVRKVEVPEGLPKRWGLTTGTAHKAGGWQLALKRSRFPVAERLGNISSIDVPMCADEGKAIVFKLPKDTLPTSYHPGLGERVEETPAPLPSQAWSEPKPDATPAPSPAPVAAPAPMPQFPASLRLELPKSEAMSVERAIRYLNQQKLKLGTSLRFTVNEGGTLSAVHRIE